MADAPEVCFPRGNLPVSSRKKKGKMKKKLIENVKNSNNHSDDRNVQHNMPIVDEVDELDKLAKSEDKKAQKINVHYLTYENLRKGMLVLGCLVDIQPDKLLVSLPNSIVGVILIKEISRGYTEIQQTKSSTNSVQMTSSLFDLFEIGQLLVCAVILVDSNLKEIHLTLNPTIVNSRCEMSKLLPGMHISGCVHSVEDHGYIIDVGNRAIHAFVPSAMHGSDTMLQRHQVVRCSIVEAKSCGRILILSTRQDHLNKVVTKETLGNSLQSLYPGTIANFSHVTSKHSGKIGKVGSIYSSVSMLHSSSKSQTSAEANDDGSADRSSDKPENDENSAKKRKLSLFNFACQPLIDPSVHPGCVLYSLHRSAAICLNSKVWEDDKRIMMQLDLKERYRVGQKYSVSILDKIPSVGLVCQLHKNGPYGVIGVDDISDDSHVHLDNINLQQELKVRIIGNVSLDGVINLSAKESVYNAAYLSFDDVQPGDPVSAQVAAVSKSGLEVNLGSRHDKKFVTCPITGFVPAFHMSDINLKNPEKVFKMNEVLHCRVLSVDCEHKLITLTNKPSLVQSNLPIICHYEQLSVDDVVHVYIKAIKEQGCIVGLYDNLKGFVPRNQINLPLPSSTIRDEYHPGQVVRARVCACNPRDKKLVMSFITEVKQKNKS